jgi:hypothetical protein
MTCSCYQVIDDGRAIGNVPNSSIYKGAQLEVSIHDSRYTDPTDLETALNGQSLVYPIATPTEITLSPQLITLLKGQNVLTTDGDTAAITYTEMTTLDDMRTLINAAQTE